MATSYRRYAGGAVTILLAAARSGATASAGGPWEPRWPNGDLVRAALRAEGVELPLPSGASPRHRGVRRARGAHCGAVVRDDAGGGRHITVQSLSAAAPRGGDLVCVGGTPLWTHPRPPLHG